MSRTYTIDLEGMVEEYGTLVIYNPDTNSYESRMVQTVRYEFEEDVIIRTGDILRVRMQIIPPEKGEVTDG